MSSELEPARKKAKFAEPELGDITEKNLQQIKMLHQVIFPIPYNPKFYTSLTQRPELSKVAYFNDIAVGVVCSTIHPMPNNKPGSRLYIMTLGVLAKYRQMGIGTRLLEYVLDYVKDKADIQEVYLHVWTSNTEAINFYKRFGFEITETIEGYYKKIDPPNCHVLVKKLPRPLPAADKK